ncbi:MAG: hypothetical protein PHU21_15135, partial [Elusimicrobia bacterium]|nr:hypothetical protein [Elusimicrobiota bacterium]
RVADFFRILIRIFVALVRPDAGPLFAGDPEFALFARIYCDQPSDSAEPLRRPPWALLDAARVLLDLIAAAPAPRSREALLREAVARVKKATPVPVPPPQGPAGPGPQRPAQPGPGGPPAAKPLAPLRPLERSAIDGVRRLLRRRPVRRLGRIVIESAGRGSGGGPAIALGLRLDGHEVMLDLWDRGRPGRSFFTTRLFKARYRKGGSGWTPDAAAAERLRLLVVLIERRIAALRSRDGLAAGRPAP